MAEHDWAMEAAKELHQEQALCERVYLGPERIAAIISKHYPLKRDVAYMPVPRCETCQFWSLSENARRLGSCASQKMVAGYGLTEDDIPDGGVELENDEGWSMHTDKSFGCVHWEEKR